jgi:hypothetical protein
MPWFGFKDSEVMLAGLCGLLQLLRVKIARRQMRSRIVR